MHHKWDVVALCSFKMTRNLSAAATGTTNAAFVLIIGSYSKNNSSISFMSFYSFVGFFLLLFRFCCSIFFCVSISTISRQVIDSPNLSQLKFLNKEMPMQKKKKFVNLIKSDWVHVCMQHHIHLKMTDLQWRVSIDSMAYRI